MENTAKRATSALLALIMLIAALGMTSCGAPKIDEVRDEFTALIKASFSVNDILFGDGLSSYGNLSYDEDTKTYYILYHTKNDGELCAYRDTEAGKYVVLKVTDTDGEGCVYKNEKKGKYYYPTDLEYVEADNTLPDTPYGYLHVRTDERCTTINEIAALSATVYSEDYLADMFTILFGDINRVEDSGTTPAKYVEMTDEDSGKTYLLCATTSLCPPIDDGSRIYDFDSMKVAKRSRRNYVNIEIRAYGRYVDLEIGEIATGWHTVNLSFTRQNGEWRLDSPTY